MEKVTQITLELGKLLKTNFELFDFEYQFDDQQFKEEIEQAVIDYYYFYEIGQATPEVFKHKFRARWLRMISYYNELYNTTLLDYDPLSNYKMSETLEELAKNSQQTDSKADAQATTEGEGNTSDYPQQPIANGDYLAGATNSKNETNTTDNTNTNTTAESNRDYTKTIEGITGITYPELIQQQRSSIIRIKDMMIEELKPCFLLVY